jgi:hypothetical protein
MPARQPRHRNTVAMLSPQMVLEGVEGMRAAGAGEEPGCEPWQVMSRAFWRARAMSSGSLPLGR